MAGACAARVVARCVALSYLCPGATALRDCGVAIEDEKGLESRLVNFDGGRFSAPVRRLGRHHC